MTQHSIKKTAGRLGSGLQLSLLVLAMQGLPVNAQETHQPDHNTTVGQPAQSWRLNIPAQPLDEALLDFANQTGIGVFMDDLSLADQTSPALHGEYSLEQALQQLLSGTGLVYRVQDNTITLSRAESALADSIELTPITVAGSAFAIDRDEAGYNAIYDENYSSVYAGKEQIERYKGASPADLFKGMANVYSGDARNSGAVDPNIRGIQGPGRIALTVDGTEQAMTAYRGYAGASNRNYIDPNLLGSVQVIKGPNLVRDVKTGVGGAVVAKTLEVADVLEEGESWGGQLKIEGSNNTTKERLPTSYVGQDYRDVVEALDIRGNSSTGWQSIGFTDPLSYVPIKQEKDNKSLRLQDQAYRVALATRQERFEALAVYAYRNRGNYFAGKKDHEFYLPELSTTAISAPNFVHNMAHAYKPGNEITNTSNEMESWLLKGKLNISDEQNISIGYRDSTHTYGEIMPSMIPVQEILEQNGDQFVLPQWPLSNVSIKSYDAEYQYKPLSNRYVDLHAGIWMTDTDSATYTGSGLPHALTREYSDTVFGNCWRRGEDNCARNPNIPYAPLLDTGLTKATHTRQGFRVSNRLALTEQLGLTLGGDFQYEKLRGKDNYEETRNYGGFRTLPRSGRRQEHELNFNFDWQPTHWLSVQAGARHMSYWVSDDFRRDRVNAGDTTFSTLSTPIYKSIHYRLQTPSLTKEQQDLFAERMEAYYRHMYTLDGESGNRPAFNDPAAVEASVQQSLSRLPALRETSLGTSQRLDFYALWVADANGDFSVENNPFFNGDIDPKELDPSGYSVIRPQSTAYSNKTIAPQTWRDRGWVPSFSIAANLTDNGRIYLNYSEALRFPSMFEGTLGFSASATPNGLKPEHTYFHEIGYSHNLSGLLNARYADIKLAYFHNITKDVIDRNSMLRFSNLERQTLSGFELQSRYDSGRVFADLSLVYNQKNEVCDKKFAASTINERAYSGELAVTSCTDNGFPGGFLASLAVPKYMGNATLGLRFFNERLELGTRATYYYRNDKAFSESFVPSYTGVLAAPLFWDDILTFDAFVGYSFNKNISVDLVGTNLTNLYYADPLSRSSTAAPGRTFKLALTANF